MIANLKLPIGLVAAIVAQAMGLAVWINNLQGEASTALSLASSARARVTQLEDRLAETETRLAILNDQQKQINAEHMQIGDSFQKIWDELDKRSPAPVPTGTQRSYGY
jgi:TolA-binding protein